MQAGTSAGRYSDVVTLMYIKNRAQLESHGNRTLRRDILDIAEHALEQVNPYRATRELVRLESNLLHVGDLAYDLDTRGDIYVLGAGKASVPIARALEDVLGDRIRYSAVAAKEGQHEKTTLVRVMEASHPLPDERGYEAASEAMRLARQADENDIVFCAVTGGSSALWPLPVPCLSLEQKREVHRLLLSCGASIREINAVRKHLSQIKGGRLALAAFPAEVINLTVSDVTGDPLDYITCPTVPDTSTFDDARAVLDRYQLWDVMPGPAADYLRAGTAERENPRDFGQSRVHTFLLVASGQVCDEAARAAAARGYEPMILTYEMEGDSAMLGAEFGRAIATNGRAPSAIIAGGETTVTLRDRYGEGGPNQEFACAAALAVTSHDQVVLSLDTDGTDGPTDLAGGLVDLSTVERARAEGLDIAAALAGHDVSPLLRRLEDAVVTGHTGTNVNDLKIALCG